MFPQYRTDFLAVGLSSSKFHPMPRVELDFLSPSCCYRDLAPPTTTGQGPSARRPTTLLTYSVCGNERKPKESWVWWASTGRLLRWTPAWRITTVLWSRVGSSRHRQTWPLRWINARRWNCPMTLSMSNHIRRWKLRRIGQKAGTALIVMVSCIISVSFTVLYSHFILTMNVLFIYFNRTLLTLLTATSIVIFLQDSP